MCGFRGISPGDAHLARGAEGVDVFRRARRHGGVLEIEVLLEERRVAPVILRKCGGMEGRRGLGYGKVPSPRFILRRGARPGAGGVGRVDDSRVSPERLPRARRTPCRAHLAARRPRFRPARPTRQAAARV